jgi:rod shape-determining protein MreC
VARSVAKPKRSRRTLTTLVVLVLLSVSIITLSETGRATVLTSGVKTIASDIYSPLRSGVNGLLDPIGRFFSGAVNYGSVVEENQKLRAQISALEGQRATTRAAQRQYSELQHLLQLDKLPALSGLTLVTAEVTSLTTSDFAATITIDKGRSAGVTLDYPVLAAGGLAGQVVIASHSGATVRLLTDGQSKVGVTFGRGEEATLAGVGAGKLLQVDDVPATTRVSVGELLVTSGLQGAAYPAGIPVARVTSVHTVVGAADKQVTAKPIADLQDLTFVQVLVWSGSS